MSVGAQSVQERHIHSELVCFQAGEAGEESSDSDGEQEETSHKLIRKVSTSGQMRAKVGDVLESARVFVCHRTPVSTSYAGFLGAFLDLRRCLCFSVSACFLLCDVINTLSRPLILSAPPLKPGHLTSCSRLVHFLPALVSLSCCDDDNDELCSSPM